MASRAIICAGCGTDIPEAVTGTSTRSSTLLAPELRELVVSNNAPWPPPALAYIDDDDLYVLLALMRLHVKVGVRGILPSSESSQGV